MGEARQNDISVKCWDFAALGRLSSGLSQGGQGEKFLRVAQSESGGGANQGRGGP